MKTVHVNTLIASPEIVECTGLTVYYGFEMTKGKFSESNWSVWVRDNNDEWIYIQDIDSTAGQSKEYVLDFDQPITVSEIVIQPPREYNAFSYNMTLQIVHIKH